MTDSPPMDRTETDLEKLDKQTLWHPFTQMKEWMESPQLVIERGRGVYLYDTRGRKYLDGVSSLWANIHGHSHPHIVRAIRRQLDRLDHSTLLGLTNVPAVQLAGRLVELTPPNLTRVFFSDDGATAGGGCPQDVFPVLEKPGPAMGLQEEVRGLLQRLPRRHPGIGERGRRPALPRDLSPPAVSHPQGGLPLSPPMPPGTTAAAA